MNALGKIVLPLLAGTLFGGGLSIGGMTDPARVRGFLDVFGRWDATLAFVMAAAVGVMAVAWRVKPRLARPLFETGWSLPDRTEIDARLAIGSLIFGIGWGIAGLCPGPAIALLGVQPLDVLPFVGALLLGMALHRVAIERTKG